MFRNIFISIITVMFLSATNIARAQTMIATKPSVANATSTDTAIITTTDNTQQTTENNDSARQAQIKEYYQLGNKYREGNGVEQDYEKAFQYFSKAAELGDAQSIYAVAYMHYKGLGTTQDYAFAARLFQQGAYQDKANSMYFYALCWRNGYGLTQNEDSSKYWLNKAANLGYKQAEQELKTEAAENGNDSAKQLVQRISNAAIPDKVVLNEFQPIVPSIPDSEAIEGDYEGYIIQYDWSGKNPVSSKKLNLTIENNEETEGVTSNAQSQTQNAESTMPNAQSKRITAKAFSATTDNRERTTKHLSGSWREEGVDTATAKFTATLKKDSLVFADTRYKRKDHYSPSQAVNYDFQRASLSLVRKGDSVYLAGNVYMYSPDRKEPSKPLFVALVKTTADAPAAENLQQATDNGQQTTASEPHAKILSVYPNPFTSYVTVAFEVSKAGNVGIELYNMAGVLEYRKPSQQLAAGRYAIHVEPQTRLAAQVYVLRLVFDNGQQTVKVIKR